MSPIPGAPMSKEKRAMKRINNFVARLVFLSIMLFLFSGCGSAIAAFSDYVVDTDYVVYNQGTILIIDTRVPAEYDIAHIPGAINVPYSTFIFSRVEGSTSLATNYMIPTPSEFIALLNSWGVTPSTTVVVYGDDVDSWPYRLAWNLKLYGHEAAYVMDGGLPKWQYIDKYPVSKTATLPTPNTTSYVITGYSNILAYKYDVKDALPKTFGGTVTGVILLDVLPTSMYTAGHIPGSYSLLYTDTLTNNSQGIKYTPYGSSTPQTIQVLLSEEKLQTMFADKFTALGLNVTPKDTLVTYCGGGVAAAQVAELLLAVGYPNVQQYQGSMTEWDNSYLPDYPIVTGSKPE
jgi:thiosulfate/3-mercaptopyruvate sulfurtransferase